MFVVFLQPYLVPVLACSQNAVSTEYGILEWIQIQSCRLFLVLVG